jgi:diketogulonate reductase-like aldo/keto reductase
MSAPTVVLNNGIKMPVLGLGTYLVNDLNIKLIFIRIIINNFIFFII